MIRRLATVWLALCIVAMACASDVRARIDAARKSPLVVEVIDWNDNPVPDVEIEATQLTADVKFGCNIFMLGHCSSEDLEQAYRERFRDVFDFATLLFRFDLVQAGAQYAQSTGLVLELRAFILALDDDARGKVG